MPNDKTDRDIATDFQVRVVSGRVPSQFTSVAWSPDGTKVAAGSSDNTVRVWDAAAGRLLATLEGHTDWVRSVAWSPDGATLASGSFDRTVRLWDTAYGRLRATLEGHTHWVRSVAWSPDGATLASGSHDNTVRIWDAAAGRLHATLEGHTNGVLSVAWSPDGVTLASGSYDNTVRIWDAAAGRLRATLEGHTNRVQSVAWSPDGATLASGGSSDNTVRLWDAAGRLLATFEGHTNRVQSVAWSPDGATLASGGSSDNTVRIWDAAAGRLRATLEGHTNVVLSVAWSPDGATLASGSDDQTVRLWDAAAGRLRATLEGHTHWVPSVAWSPDGATLASGSSDQTVRLWDAAAGRLRATLEGHTHWVPSVAWSPDGATLASGSYDKTVRLWDAAAGRRRATLEGHTNGVLSVAWSPDGATLASGSDDKTVRLWDAAAGRLRATLEGHTNGVLSVAWSPDGATLASGSYDNTVRLWDAAGRLRATLEGHTNGVLSVAWSPDGATLASGSYDNTVRLWDAAGRLRATLEGHTSWVPSVAWSPDGATLASGSDDKTVRLWDAAAGRLRATLEAHTNGVLSVAWSPDGVTLASGSDDQTVRLWDVKTGAEIKLERIPAGYKITAVSFEPIRPVRLAYGQTNLGNDYIIVQTVDLAPTAFESLKESSQYVSAKIVLVGESEVGKSSLALRLVEDRYEDQESTHGMRLWSMPAEELSAEMVGPPHQRRDVVIWDLGGQAEYRLVHQLFIHDTTLALIMLDPTRGQKAFDDVAEWDLRLKNQRGRLATTKLLVGTKLDEETQLLDHTALNSLLSSCGCREFIETSAKVPRGIDELRSAIAREINWEELSFTSRPRLFQSVRKTIQESRERGDVVILHEDLVRAAQAANPQEFDLAAVNTVVDQLAGQGVIVKSRLDSGHSALVLQIGYIEVYAASLITLARNNPRGVPAIEVAAAVALKSYPGIKEQDRLPLLKERVVLDCVIQLLLEHGICLKHEGLLIFPALFPPIAGSDGRDVTQTVSLYYDFSGAIDNIYSSLVVRLALSERFGRVRLWHDRAEYERSGSGICGIRKVSKKSGWAHLDLFFSEETPPETRTLFTVFVEEHLRGEGITIREVLGMTCGTCGHSFDESLVKDRIADDHTDIGCPKCDARLAISEGAVKARESNPAVLQEMLVLKTIIEKKQKIEAESAKRATSTRKPNVDGPIRILHLSDLHFAKVDDPATKLQALAQDLRDKQEGLGFEHLDYLVISGDLTDRAMPEEFEQAYFFLSALIERFGLSPVRCIIVPGNHDLSWEKEVYSWRPKRSFSISGPPAGSVEQGAGYLVRLAEEYPKRFENFSKFYHDLMQQPYPLNPIAQGLSFLDTDRRIQFLTLNSAWEIDEYHPEISSIHDGALTDALLKAEKQIEDAIKHNALAASADILRLAVWHHPVTGNEKIVADAFLERLRKDNVKLCLHGHVHENRADVIGYLHPRKIRVAGAGSFGAGAKQRPEATPRLYNLLEIERDFSRIRVHTRSLSKESGAWRRWSVWPSPDNSHDLSYYDIYLKNHQ